MCATATQRDVADVDLLRPHMASSSSAVLQPSALQRVASGTRVEVHVEHVGVG